MNFVQREKNPREVPAPPITKDVNSGSVTISPATVEFLDSFLPLPGIIYV